MISGPGAINWQVMSQQQATVGTVMNSLVIIMMVGTVD